jgi:hypothetical protein
MYPQIWPATYSEEIINLARGDSLELNCNKWRSPSPCSFCINGSITMYDQDPLPSIVYCYQTDSYDPVSEEYQKSMIPHGGINYIWGERRYGPEMVSFIDGVHISSHGFRINHMFVRKHKWEEYKAARDGVPVKNAAKID